MPHNMDVWDSAAEPVGADDPLDIKLSYSTVFCPPLVRLVT